MGLLPGVEYVELLPKLLLPILPPGLPNAGKEKVSFKWGGLGCAAGFHDAGADF